MLASFEHYVGQCWIMLEDVGLSSKFSSNIMQHRWPNNVARCWLRLNWPLISKCLEPFLEETGFQGGSCFRSNRGARFSVRVYDCYFSIVYCFAFSRS